MSNSYQLPTSRSPLVSIVGKISLFRFDKRNLDVVATVLPALSDPGRVHTNLNACYYIKLWSKFTWNISFHGNWDNQPAPGFSTSDCGTSSGITYKFGNRE
jgi:hypothetical protein